MSSTLPIGAVFRDVGFQDNILYVWAEIDTAENTTEIRSFSAYATGPEQPPGLVFHVYEEIVQQP